MWVKDLRPRVLAGSSWEIKNVEPFYSNISLVTHKMIEIGEKLMTASVGTVAIKLDKCLRLCNQTLPFHRVFQTVTRMPNEEREKLIKNLYDFETELEYYCGELNRAVKVFSKY
jgi:hypothetical protein